MKRPIGLKLQDRCLFKEKTSVIVGRTVRILRHVGKISTFAKLSTKPADDNVSYTFYVQTSSAIKLVDGCFCKLEDDENFDTERDMLLYILKKKEEKTISKCYNGKFV